MSGTVDKPLTKADFAERSVPYAVLLRVIDAQEKLTYLKRELSLFFAFMLVFVLYVVQSQPVRDSFFLERAARGALVQAEFASPSDINAPLSFASVADREEYFTWLQTIVVNGVLATAKTQNGTFATYSTLLWGVQIRQARVGAGAGCELPQRIRESGIVTRPCTAEYSSSTRSVQPYGPSRTENVPGADGVVRPITRFEYTWSDAPVTKASSFSGRFASYDGSGFVRFLSLNSSITELQEQVESLQATFVDDQTRALFTTLIVYNAHFNLFMRCNLVTEFSPAGNAQTASAFHTAELVPVGVAGGAFVMVLNVMLFIFIVFYIFKLVFKELRFLRRIQPFWITVDIVSVVLLVFHLAYVIRFLAFREGQDSLVQALGGATYYEIDSSLNWYSSLREYYAINMVLLCVRVFKYLKLSKGLAMVWKTMSHAVMDIMFYFFLFAIMFFGFLLCGYLAFGPHLEDYSSVPAAASTLLRMIIGEIDYHSIREVNPGFAWVFFAAYVAMFFFLLVNLFLAIILDAWHYEKARERSTEGEIDIVENIRNDLRAFWEQFRKGWKQPRYYRERARRFGRWVTRADDETKTFMADEMVLQRLQEWKRKRQNRNVNFLNITTLQSALEGSNQEFKVTDAQLVHIFKRCESHLISGEDAQRMDQNEEGEDEPQFQDMNLAALKKLQAAFTALADAQRASLDTVRDRLDALRQLQVQTGGKVDYLDGQVRKIVPHFAET